MPDITPEDTVCLLMLAFLAGLLLAGVALRMWESCASRALDRVRCCDMAPMPTDLTKGQP